MICFVASKSETKKIEMQTMCMGRLKSILTNKRNWGLITTKSRMTTDVLFKLFVAEKDPTDILFGYFLIIFYLSDNEILNENRYNVNKGYPKCYFSKDD